MAPEMKPCIECGQLVRTDAKACAYCKTPTSAPWGAWQAAQTTRCDVVDFNGNQCALQAGHAGQHGAALAAAAKPPASFARIIVTPIIVLIAGYLLLGLVGLAVGGVISIAWIMVSTRVS